MKAYREALDNDIHPSRNHLRLVPALPVMNGGSEAELRGTRHTLVTVLEGLLRGASDHSVHYRDHLAAREAICGITADTIMLQPYGTMLLRWMTRRWPTPNGCEAGDRRRA